MVGDGGVGGQRRLVDGRRGGHQQIERDRARGAIRREVRLAEGEAVDGRARHGSVRVDDVNAQGCRAARLFLDELAVGAVPLGIQGEGVRGLPGDVDVEGLWNRVRAAGGELLGGSIGR